MNAPITLLFVLVVFAFGYRFYAKFLANVTFRLGTGTNSIRPHGNPDRSDRVGAAMLLGQHVGLVATAITVSTVAVAVVWGWVPALLWIVVGTTVAGGTYGIGTLWLSVRHPGQGLGTVMQSYLPGPLWSATLLLAVLLLTTFNATLLVIVSQLLVNHASIVLPFWTELFLAIGLGVVLRGRRARSVWIAGPATLVLLTGLILLLSRVSLGFSGAFGFDIDGNTAFSIDAGIGWMVLLLFFVAYVQRFPVGTFLRPYALLSTGQFALVWFGLVFGIVILHPPMIAPRFHTLTDGPAALPWLFLTISGGAIAGITLLIASALTGPLVTHVRELRFVGYGGALVEGLIAVSALLVCSAGLDANNWNVLYGHWTQLLDPSYLLEVYVNGGGYFGGALGLSNETGSNFTALALAALSFVSLEAGVRLQMAVLTETGRRFRSPSPDPKPNRIPWGVLLLVAVVVVADANGPAPTTWLIFTSANGVFACMGLLLVVAALGRQRSLAVSAPLVLMLVVTLWSLTAAIGYWWQHSAWIPATLDLLLLGLGGWISLETARTLSKSAATGA